MLSEALLCMTLNVYFEARSEPVEGQMAVALVTLNRAKIKKQKICDVILEPKQFSWLNEYQHVLGFSHEGDILVLRNIAKNIVSDLESWKVALGVAKKALGRRVVDDITDGALFYHADYVSPKWRHSLEKTTEIGTHIFYKIPEENDEDE